MTAPNIAITDSASSRIAALVSAEKSELPLKLRISVSGGGCSGFQYHFILDDAVLEDDVIFEKNNTAVIIDSISLGLLSDAVINYVEDLTSAQFVIENPNATSSCGCGNSFSM
jgi:iron-sulfur cluster insertion protein